MTRKTGNHHKLRRLPASPSSVKEVVAAVATACGVLPDHLMRQDRSRPLLHSRQLAMWVCERRTAVSLRQVAVEFRRDHKTVLHSIAMAEKRMHKDPKLAALARKIVRQLGEEAEEATNEVG